MLSTGIIADSYNAPTGGGAFDPTSLTGLQGWWDAADISTITKDGDGHVSQWNDKSGNGFHAVQPVLAAQPGFHATIINGLPGIQFIYTALKTTCPSETKPFSIFTVVRIGQYAHDISLIGSSYNADILGCLNIDVSGNKWRFMKRQQEMLNTCTTALTTYTPYLLGLTYSATGVINWYLNGFAAGTATADRTFPTTTMCLGNVAGDNGGVHPFWGQIGEFTKYNRVLAAAEITELSNYLMSKWMP